MFRLLRRSLLVSPVVRGAGQSIRPCGPLPRFLAGKRRPDPSTSDSEDADAYALPSHDMGKESSANDMYEDGGHLGTDHSQNVEADLPSMDEVSQEAARLLSECDRNEAFTFLAHLSMLGESEISRSENVAQLAAWLAEQDLKEGPHHDRGSVIRILVTEAAEGPAAAARLAGDLAAGNDQLCTAMVLAHRARLLSSAGQVEEALEAAWRAAEIDPNLGMNLHTLCLLSAELGGEESEDPLIEIIEKHGPAAYAAMNLRASMILSEWNDRGRGDDVEEFYENALALLDASVECAAEAGASETIVATSGMLGQLELYEEMEAIIAPRYNLELHDPRIGVNLMMARFANGEEDEAKGMADQLKQLPDNVIGPVIADIHEQLSRMSGAT